MDPLIKGTRSQGLYFDKDAPLHIEIRDTDPVIDNESEEARLWYNKTDRLIKYTYYDEENSTIGIATVGEDISSSEELKEFIDNLSSITEGSGSDLIGVKELVSENEVITIPAGTLTESLISILNKVSEVDQQINNNFIAYLSSTNEYIVKHNLNTIYLSVQVFAKKNTEVNYKLIMPDITILDSSRVKVSILDDVPNDSICSIMKMVVI